MTRPEPHVHIISLGTGPVLTGSPAATLGTPVGGGDNGRPDGVWARWQWDGRSLTVTNDRLGFYPLYYCVSARSIAVSPSISKLLELGAPRALDDAAVSVFLRVGYFLGEDTPFAAIRALPPGATLRWRDGRSELSSEPPRPPAVDLDRDEAMRQYDERFRQAVHRRPPVGRCGVPLSGGRDSRHIVLELHRQGIRPQCVTASGFGILTSEDMAAAKLTRELGLPLTVLRLNRPIVDAELEKNERTGYCTDEHAWYLGVADHVDQQFDTVYDGIGGDVLSAGLFLDAEGLALMRARRFDDMAERTAAVSELALSRTLAPPLWERFPRRLAIRRLAREMARYADWPNPVGAFYFFNRTRREIALSPYRLISQRLHVHAPYLDRDVFELLAGLPAEHFLDKRFHTETIARAFPAAANVPYSGPGRLAPGAWRRTAGHVLRLMPLLLHQRAGMVLNRRFLALRMGRSLLHRGYCAEFVQGSRWIPYLIQLAELSDLADTRPPPVDSLPWVRPQPGAGS